MRSAIICLTNLLAALGLSQPAMAGSLAKTTFIK